MVGTDRKCRRESKIRKPVAAADGADQGLDRLVIFNPLAREDMDNGAARVFALELVLQVQVLENVVGIVHRELSRIGVEWLALAAFEVIERAGAYDVRILVPVELRQAIARSLGGARFKVVAVARRFLEFQEAAPQVIHDPEGELLPCVRRDALAEQIPAGLVHADHSDRREVILPETLEMLLDVAQIVPRVGVEIVPGELFQHFPFDLEALPGEHQTVFEQPQKFIFVVGEIADPRQIDRHHADRAGQGIGPEQTAAALFELAVVEPEAAAHRARILRPHVRVDEV